MPMRAQLRRRLVGFPPWKSRPHDAGFTGGVSGAKGRAQESGRVAAFSAAAQAPIRQPELSLDDERSDTRGEYYQWAWLHW